MPSRIRRSSLAAWGPRRAWAERLFASAPYRIALAGRTPRARAVTPPPPWPGDPEAGNDLLAGLLSAAGQNLPLESFRRLPAPAGPGWLAAAHDFAWLDDLHTRGPEGQGRARDLLQGWCETFSRWHPVAWQPEVLGRRLVRWNLHFHWLTDDTGLDAPLLAAMSRQLRHLGRAWKTTPPDSRRLHALIGLAYGRACLRGAGKPLSSALVRLAAELDRQILPDGGHIERNPSVQLVILGDLVVLRGILSMPPLDVPDWLQAAIDRMGPMLRSFRHGDGGLALFNGGLEENRGRVDTVLAQAKTKGRALASAPHSGFNRLAAGRTVVILDTGAPPPPGADGRAHAGTLAFEMSVGRHRLIVNCGHHARGEGDWAHALRTTAAHSTLAVDEIPSAEVIPGKGLGRQPRNVMAARRERDGDILLEAAHDGYRDPLGLTHRRLLYLAADGTDLRGEDELSGPGGQRFMLRFHLHPRVSASLVGGADGVLLKLPDGSGWRFRARGGLLGLEESVYLGHGRPEPTRQIVLSGALAPPVTTIKWRLSRA